MADDQADIKVSYPYMSSSQWYGIRAKFRQSLPSLVDVDWIMAALGTSEKGARNVMPQLRAIGLIDGEGKPVADLVHDLRDDDTYASACKRIRESLYPSALISAWGDPDEDAEKVAAWFMRNAGTGSATAKLQARLYLLLLKGALPSPEEAAKATAKRSTSAPTKKVTVRPAAAKIKEESSTGHLEHAQPQTLPPMAYPVAPNLHIDMQIHISADASDTQIDTIFKSLTKHLYGRE